MYCLVYLINVGKYSENSLYSWMYPYQRSGAAASDSLLKAAGGQPAEKATQKLLDLRPYLTKSEAGALAL